MGLVISNLIAFIIGGVISFYISKYFYCKSKSDSDVAEEGKKYNADNFTKHLKKSRWEKKLIDRNEVWICQDDVRYQIHMASERIRDFSEEWTDRCINKKAFFVPVLLKISGNVFEELNFVYCDEMRYLVPVPEIELDESSRVRSFYWDANKFYWLVHSIIGSYRSIPDLSAICKVEIRHEQSNKNLTNHADRSSSTQK